MFVDNPIYVSCFHLWLVRYQMKEETRCLNVISLDSSHPPSHVALSPDGLVVAVTINTSVWLYSPTSGKLLDKLNDIHNGTTNIFSRL